MNAQRERSVVAPAADRPGSTVLWIIAILLAIIATTLIVSPGDGPAINAAMGDSPMVGARGIFAFTGQLDKNSYGLFMMDVDSSNVWCYQYVPGTRRLKLVAARSFLYDRYLEDYGGDEPSPEQIKVLLDDQRRIKNRISRGGIAPDDPDEGLGINVPTDPSDLQDQDGNTEKE
jgi:hypothetical protein